MTTTEELSWAMEEAKRTRLAAEARQMDAELAFIAATAAERPSLSWTELWNRWRELREDALAGVQTRWLSAMPGMNPNLMRHRASLEPEGGEQTWEGAWPLTSAEHPRRGQSVVYTLHLAGRVMYVGSSRAFVDRLIDHARDGKTFDSWWAVYCPTRAEAYALEQEYLDAYMPPLNKKRHASGAR